MNPGETLIGALDVMSYGLVACYYAEADWEPLVCNRTTCCLELCPHGALLSTRERDAGQRSSTSESLWRALADRRIGWPEGSIIGLVVLAASFFAFRIIFQERDSHREHVA